MTIYRGLVWLPALTFAAGSLCGGAEAADEPAPKKTIDFQEIADLVESGDSFEAMAILHERGRDVPGGIAGAYSNLMFNFYRKNQDVARMVMVGRAGIQYCLAEAVACSEQDPERAAKLRGTAKAMAYNLAANTWPSWDEKGITITTSDLAAGMDAARLNLRLARELERGSDVLGNAHWVLGAHHLAAGQRKEALDTFDVSAARFREANKPDYEQMAVGYRGITLMTDAATRAEGQREFDAALAALKKLDTDDARFFAAQLQSVAKVFAP